MHIEVIPTSPIEGQKTGTSGLRKKVKHIQSHPHYIENWIQSLVNALDGSQIGSTFVIGGDGRYLNETAAIAAIEILAANGVEKVIIGANALLSTPAVSNIIRSRKSFGGLIMTASHNPAGPDGDWGIKFNYSNGEPAPEKITEKIHQETLKITAIQRAKLGLEFDDLSTVGERTFAGSNFILEIIDPVNEYMELLRGIFDFEKISKFLKSAPPIVFDGMHAVTGIYAKRIFQNLSNRVEFLNCDPSPDFNGNHPDPNLVYAHDLVGKMMNPAESPFMFGAASDGDGDRNMIMGNGWFVTPSDSLAIIADFALKGAIPYFEKFGGRRLKGVARSMPTSRAIDVVCSQNNIPCYETPTGWKFFCNLMDSGLVNLCGEESFGTGSDHIREKDGIWAIIAWLTILEFANRGEKNFFSVRQINENHWDKYGRHIYCRCDYEEVDSNSAISMMDNIQSKLGTIVNTQLCPGWTVASAEEYTYIDPVDKTESKNQGLIIRFHNMSRLVYRLSGTGSSGATIRVYMEYYVREWRNEEIGKTPLMQLSLTISEIEKFTGRKSPTLVT